MNRPNQRPRGQSDDLLNPPGMNFFILALYLNGLFGFRGVLFHLGVSASLRAISQIYGVLIMGALIAGFILQVRGSRKPSDQRSVWFWRTTWWWLTICGLLGVWGILRQNGASLVAKEWMLLTSIGLMAYGFADRGMARVLIRHLTIIFYLTLPFVLFYYDIPGVIITAEGSYADMNLDVGYRFLDTVGYSMRFLLAPGILLGAVSVVAANQSKVWRIAQFASFLIYFLLEIAVFKFRGAVVGFGILLISLLLLRAVFQRGQIQAMGAKGYLLIFAVLVPLVWAYTQTTSWIELRDRFYGESQKGGVFESRIEEATALFSELRQNILIGRGLGGGFDITGIIDMPGAREWSTVHFGLLVFLLKGGVLFLVSFLFYIAPGVRRRSQVWYHEPLNIAAIMLLPYAVFTFSFNPFALSHDFIIVYASSAFMFGRFGCADSPQESMGMFRRQ